MSTGTLVALILSTLAIALAVGSFLFLYRAYRRVTTKLKVRDRLHKELAAKVEVVTGQIAGTEEQVRSLRTDTEHLASRLERADRDRGLILQRLRTLENDRTALRSDIQKLSESVARRRDQMAADFERLIERVRAIESSRSALSRELRELRADVETAHSGQPNMPTEPNPELSLRDAIDTLPT